MELSRHVVHRFGFDACSVPGRICSRFASQNFDTSNFNENFRQILIGVRTII